MSANLDHVVAIYVDLFYLRVVKIVREDTKPGHVLIDFLKERRSIKGAYSQLLNA